MRSHRLLALSIARLLGQPGVAAADFSRTVVADAREFFAQFQVRAKCPPKCTYTWSNNCAPFENVLVSAQ